MNESAISTRKRIWLITETCSSFFVINHTCSSQSSRPTVTGSFAVAGCTDVLSCVRDCIVSYNQCPVRDGHSARVVVSHYTVVVGVAIGRGWITGCAAVQFGLTSESDNSVCWLCGEDGNTETL